MNFKRFVATGLAIAMLISSSSFADVVNAAEVKEGASPAVEEVSVSPAQEGETSASGDVITPSQEGSSDINLPSQTPDSEETGEPSASEDVGTPDEEEKKTDEDAVDPEQAEKAETDLEKAVEVELQGDEFEMSSDSFLKSTDYFVDQVGPLTLKPSAKLEEDILIPANCTSIPDEFFKGNRVVKTIRFEKYYMDGDQKKWEQKLTAIGKNAFENSAIEEIIGLPAGVTAFPDDCFVGSNIKVITYETDTDTEKSTIQSYSKNITSIGKNAFKGTNLEKTVFDFSACTTVDTSAFEDSNITEFIAKNVVSIGNSAFRNCSKLETFGQRNGEWPATIKSIGSSAFEATALSYVNLGSVSLTNGAANFPSLYTSTFKNCKKLTSITLPASSTVVSDNLFNGCTSLAYVSFPEPTETPLFYGVETIEYNAFYGCTALKDISLYNTHDIGELAFSGCTNLKTVLFGYDPDPTGPFVPAKIADSAFYYNLKKTAGYVMKGYDDDALRVYATKHNYSYETLNDQYDVTKSDQAQFKDTKVVVSPAKVLPGEKVTITITPKSGTSLTNFVLRGKKTNKQHGFDIISFNAREQQFSFEMPLEGAGTGPENIEIQPFTTANKDIAISSLDYDLVDDNKDPLDKLGDGSYSIDCGKKYQIRLQNTGSVPPELPTWLWSFASNKPGVVAVSSNGVVSTLGPGEAVITCKMLNGRATKSFKIFVGNRQRIGKVGIHDRDGNQKWVDGVIIPNGKKIDLDKKTVGTKIYPLVRIAKSLAAIEDVKFRVNIDAYAFAAAPPALNPTSSVVKTNWTTTDGTIAVVQTAYSTENSNTITIKKGAEGEASIGISVLNDGEKKVNEKDDEDNETFVIVEVWDDTPRIAEKEITVNAQKEENYVTLFNSYADKDAAGEIGMASGKVYEDGMFRVFYDRECTKKCTDFTVEYNKLTQRMNFATTPDYDDRTPIGKTNTYKGLWLDVTLHDRGKYIIPLPTVKIENKPLSPRLTTTGKLNLFYNTTATITEQGTVTSSHNLGDFLDKIELVSTQNYKDYGRRAVDKIDAGVTDRFRDNYNAALIATTNNRSWRVTRKAVNDPAAPNSIYVDASGKAITSGYIYLYYNGYKYPVMMAYTVPTEVTAPKYVLDYTSGTAHTDVVGQHFTVHLLNSGIKTVVSLNNLDAGEAGLVIDEATSKNDSVSRDQNDLRADLATNGIRLDIPGVPSRGVVTLRVHMTTWSDYDGKTTVPKYLRYNFTVNTTNALPRVAFDKTSAAFNLAYSNEVQKITATSSMPNFLPLVSFKDLKYTGNAAAPAKYPFVEDLIVKTVSGGAAAQIKVNDTTVPAPVVNTDDGSLSIELPTDPGTGAVTFAKGTYTYKITPVIRYGAGPATKDLAPINFSVTVGENRPTLRLTNPSFTVNYNAAIVKTPDATGTDTYENTSFCQTSYSLANLMAGTKAQDYSLDMSGAQYTAAANVPAAYKTYSQLAETKTTNPNAGALFRVIRQDPAVAPPATFAYKYTVTGAKIKKGTGATAPVATLAPFDVTIQGFSTAPATTVSAAGSLNFVDSLSAITYTFNVTNVPAIVTTARVEDHTGGSTVASNKFAMTQVLGNKYQLKILGDPWAEPEKLKPNTTYNERIYFTLEATGAKEYYVDVNVRPTQVFPKITASSSRSYIYAGEDEDADVSADLNRRLTCYINVPVAQINNYHVVSQAPAGGGTSYPAYETKSDGTYTENPAKAIYNGVRWAANTPDNYKRAFDISDVTCLKDAAGKPTGVYRFNIKLKNAAAIVQNKEMTLNFLVYFAGQAVNTAGMPASIKLTVRK